MFLSFALGLGEPVSLGISLPWYAGLVMLVITAIGIMVPAAPGYIGTLNIACTAGWPCSASAGAVGAVLVVLLLQPVAADHRGRLVYLNREGLSLRSLGQAQSGTQRERPQETVLEPRPERGRHLAHGAHDVVDVAVRHAREQRQRDGTAVGVLGHRECASRSPRLVLKCGW